MVILSGMLGVTRSADPTDAYSVGKKYEGEICNVYMITSSMNKANTPK